MPNDTPAPGWRNSIHGALCDIGRYGYSWSSSVAAIGSEAYFVSFHSGGLNPQYSSSRANGLPVRCLLE